MIETTIRHAKGLLYINNNNNNNHINQVGASSNYILGNTFLLLRSVAILSSVLEILLIMNLLNQSEQ